ncbi:MAG: hypothetical protein ACTSQI_17430 [Candidatus Helarchaeota archaeon]
MNESSPILLHYYDFEEDIIIQTMTKKEISNLTYILGTPDTLIENNILWTLITYILGTPDTLIENNILWTLTQNPNLGTANDFNVSEDIIGQGTVGYFELANQTLQDLSNYPNSSQELVVLYISCIQDNFDIVSKINIINNSTVSNPYANIYNFYKT